MTCPHRPEIDRLRLICQDCAIGRAGCGLSKRGRSFVSFDAARGEKLRDRIAAYRVSAETPEVVVTSLGAAERENLLKVIYMFSELSYDEAGLVCRMLQNRSLQQIADERGLSIQTVHARWKALTGRNAAWKALANNMIGIGRGRKPAPKDNKPTKGG